MHEKVSLIRLQTQTKQSFSSMEINSMKPKEKIEAMRKHKRARILYNLILYSLTTLITFLFVSYNFWLPAMKHFFSVSLPNNLSHFFDAKCLFVLGNIIVFILVGESKLAGARASDHIYDEYVVRSKSFREIKPEVVIGGTERSEGDFVKGLNQLEEKRIGNEEDSKIRETRVCKMSRDQKVVKRMRRINISGTEVKNMPTEELNKRVEAFIQRVNKQRLLENYYY